MTEGAAAAERSESAAGIPLCRGAQSIDNADGRIGLSSLCSVQAVDLTDQMPYRAAFGPCVGGDSVCSTGPPGGAVAGTAATMAAADDCCKGFTCASATGPLDAAYTTTGAACDGWNGFGSTEFEAWLESCLLAERVVLDKLLMQRHKTLLDEAHRRLKKLDSVTGSLESAGTSGPTRGLRPARTARSASKFLAPTDRFFTAAAVPAPPPVSAPVPPQNNAMKTLSRNQSACSEREASTCENPSAYAFVTQTLDGEPAANAEARKPVCVQSLLEACFLSAPSEVFFGVCILLNAIIIALEVQYAGFESAHVINYRGRGQPADEIWPGALDAFGTLDWIMGVIFIIELLGKVCAMRVRVFASGWNLFDFIVVAVWVISKFNTRADINASFGRMMRLARLVRLLRYARYGIMFGPIHLIVTSITASISVLFWALVLLLLLKGTVAVIVAQALQSFIRDDDENLFARTEVYEGWGNFTRALVTMFQITLANWAPPCWLLANEIHEMWSFFVVSYRCTIGFAVVQVILSVFIQQTFKAASRNEGVMIREKEVSSAANLRHLTRLFDTLDESHDGKIGKEELKEVLKKPAVRTWFGALEIDTGEAEELFDILDDGDGEINREEFVRGTQSIKGFSKAKDVFVLHRDLKRIGVLLDRTQFQMNEVITHLYAARDAHPQHSPAVFQQASLHGLGHLYTVGLL
eukprot:NODE_1861_length_2351_cov_9.726619.p1 GENE.NODE_1861_length_2351_cov_9.726619~~NODE_1861_length_2351_cov_9.726619.p1  ORF type:complete len:730 (+),score=120.81 NODE_1861_length_2351_cov_9.726619:107-2191(+)